MAWAPSSRFEDDLVDMERDSNLIHGQLAYEERRRNEFIPRPKNIYEYLSARENRNTELEKQQGGSKSREIRQSLEMMERIQRIAGTKPLGEHASMADWEDTSTVELEAVAMMRHFGMMSMAGEAVPNELFQEKEPAGNLVPLQAVLQISRNGNRTFPLIMDPNYFTPRKTRKSKNTSLDSDSTASYHTAESCATSSSSSYGSTKPDLIPSSYVEVRKKPTKYIEIPYQLLEESIEEQDEELPAVRKKSKGERKGQRPNQKERHSQMFNKKRAI